MSTPKCPVDHTTRSKWADLASNHTHSSSSSPLPPAENPSIPELPTARQTSSIPRSDSERWVYPSEMQFFQAMQRKNHSPQKEDMAVIVPIHNAVNERAWAEVMSWERATASGSECGANGAGIKLVSFKGRPKDISPRARWNMLWGYQAPFDRHDWIINRCGTEIRYVIDFYTGRSLPNELTNGPKVSFYLDVRPALDSWEGVRMRADRFWNKWFGLNFSKSIPTHKS